MHVVTDAKARIMAVPFILIFLGLMTQSFTMPMDNPETQVLTASQRFASNMYKSLSKKQDNLVFSPFSAHACLSMLYQGTDGKTKEEFEKALGVIDQSITAAGYHSVMTNLNRTQDVSVIISNKVYVMANKHFKPEFVNTVTTQFLSEVDTIDFSDGQLAAQTINSWVKDKTKQKIEELFAAGDFTFDTRAVLVNAIYFQGNWAHPFKKPSTEIKPFHIDDANKGDVEMMYSAYVFSYKEDQELNSKVLKLLYKNNQFSMIVVLPNEKNGITELENKLYNLNVNQLTEGLQSTPVKVSLPKFRIETEVDLKATLADMGHEFSTNFSKLVEGQEELTIDKAVQKAFIEVNEEGTVAAAATGIAVNWRSGLRVHEWKEFTADHPFIYMITSKQTHDEIILFYGSVRKPAPFDGK